MFEARIQIVVSDLREGHSHSCLPRYYISPDPIGFCNVPTPGEDGTPERSGAGAMCFIQSKSPVGKTMDRDPEGRGKSNQRDIRAEEKLKKKECGKLSTMWGEEGVVIFR